MIIEKKIRLKDSIYYIGINVMYGKDSKKLVKKYFYNNYFDSGDLSYLISDIEKRYLKEDINYDREVKNMNDIIYIYDNIPFLHYIKSTSNDDSTIIDIKEIKKYIRHYKIKLKKSYKNSVCPLFFN